MSMQAVSESNDVVDVDTDVSGCDATAFPYHQQAALTGDFFDGCLRSLSINGQLVDWHSTHEIVDVHISGCPIADDHVHYA